MKKRMPESIDEKAQARRRRDSWKSAIVTTVWLLLAASVLLLLRQRYVSDGFGRAVIAIIALLDVGMAIPVWISLKIRLKEIEGGEEDAAAQY